MKKKEMIFFTVLLIVAVVFYIITSKSNTEHNTITVSIDGTVYKEFDLYQNQNYTIQTEQGYNVLQIQNHKATIIEADCPDQLCVQQKAVSHIGELIVCLPHKMVIEVK
ncbi:MAG: NusG domain II-containing protein [Firmicutes bacterium]|jgi:hypothetical protein|nr:NusG domain II-containing protein [Bacillota bacterium]